MRRRSTRSSGPVPFPESQDLDALARAQGVKPLQSIDDLKADFWPDDDSIDEFVAAVGEWRREGSGQDGSR